MARFLSATDRAIAEASARKELRIVQQNGRFGPYVTIEDEHGLIEVADCRKDAQQRIDDVLNPI